MTISALPVALWELNSSLADEVGSYTLTDSSPTVVYSAGKLGTCATKSVAAVVRLSQVDIPLLSAFAGDFSIFGWIRHASTTANKTADLYARGYTNGNIVGPRLTVNSADSISAIVQINNATVQTITHTGTGVATVWHHVALTRRASDNRFRLYFDGALDVEWTNAFSPLIKNGDGATNDTDSTCINRFWINGISSAITEHDQTGIAAVEYSADDIAYIYNAGSGLAYASWEVTGGGGTEDDDTISIQKHQLFTR